MLRPAVVWFGEALPYKVFGRAQDAASECDLMLVVGTAGAVYPAAGLANVAKRCGAKVVIVNPAPSGLDDVADLKIRGTAAAVLPRSLASGMGGWFGNLFVQPDKWLKGLRDQGSKPPSA